jgi:hypothetical protein
MATASARPAGIAFPVSRMEGRQLNIRQGSIDDLDALVDIALAAMPLDPQWNYRFPLRQKFPEDTRYHTSMRYREFLENDSRQWVVSVAESFPAGLRKGSKIVAFAVWDVSNIISARARYRSDSIWKGKTTPSDKWSAC